MIKLVVILLLCLTTLVLMRVARKTHQRARAQRARYLSRLRERHDRQ
ncbi:MAG: hypothetical protein ONB30_03195 [candidate division KSB1 bacterium]|nr:hypothetical protein [candidate division KSB1 bacterium]MDZ7294570.1 hypothetical protein [candidate division KSB1 bacterium]MDZ7337523.1 hypothetical protein [candidate division KSB1 bacterium]MDZ7386013.1 hypothetical protein [candidate division KSB1 bacterium]MDZ7392384.1 hypothetical protein [candidate division KSB1 bacterium]